LHAPGSWHSFLELYEPLRTELYRYCRYLTRSPWDAEDLAQDALARAFVTLGTMGEAPPNPRAWLFRVASNLWIDQARRRRERAQVEGAAELPPGAPGEGRASRRTSSPTSAASSACRPDPTATAGTCAAAERAGRRRPPFHGDPPMSLTLHF